MATMNSIGDEESEWEYEYDEDETEYHYVILEIPTNASKPKSKAEDLFAAHDPTKARRTRQQPLAGQKRRRRRKNADDTGNANEDDQQPGDNENVPTNNAPEANGESQPQREDAGAVGLPRIEDLNLESAIAENNELQVMDLASENPVIRYQGQLYSCHWANSLGTDLLFVKPPFPSSNTSNVNAHPPLRSFENIDLLALGSGRLIAQPASIETRSGAALKSDLDGPLPTIGQTFVNEDLVRQARFLGALAKIRAERGEAVGNLRTLAEGVVNDPAAYAPDGRTRQGRRNRSNLDTPGGRRQSMREGDDVGDAPGLDDAPAASSPLSAGRVTRAQSRRLSTISQQSEASGQGSPRPMRAEEVLEMMDLDTEENGDGEAGPQKAS